MPRPYLVFTDLDGTLLDHDSYSWAPAQSMIDVLQQRQIPIIANTSKTAAEVQRLYQAIPLNTAFVIENGAAVYLPKQEFPHKKVDWQDVGDYWCKAFASPRTHWLEVLERLKPHYKGQMTLFSEMSIGELSALTGLTESDAARAIQRDYAEPIHWYGSASAKTQFMEDVVKAQGQVLQGGRFLHVGGRTDKGSAMVWLKRQYASIKQHLPLTIALGDGGNDIAMLNAADIAVVVRSPYHEAPVLNRTSGVFHTTHTGPAGWSEALQHIILKQELSNG